jgi:hypothetical protein
LCPPRNSHFEGVTMVIPRDFLQELVHEVRPLRPWTDDTHVPF